MALCYTRRSIPSLDAAGIARARRGLRRITLRANGGREGRHRFRFVPGLGKRTDGGDDQRGQDGEGGRNGEGEQRGEGGQKGDGEGEQVKGGVGVGKMGGMMAPRDLALQAALVAASVVVGWAVAWLTVT